MDNGGFGYHRSPLVRPLSSSLSLNIYDSIYFCLSLSTSLYFSTSASILLYIRHSSWIWYLTHFSKLSPHYAQTGRCNVFPIFLLHSMKGNKNQKDNWIEIPQLKSIHDILVHPGHGNSGVLHTKELDLDQKHQTDFFILHLFKHRDGCLMHISVVVDTLSHVLHHTCSFHMLEE